MTSEKGHAWLHCGLASIWAIPLDTAGQPEANAGVRKLEEELRLEKDGWVSTTLLVLGWLTRWEAGSSVGDLHMLFCKARRAQVAADEVPSTCD